MNATRELIAAVRNIQAAWGSNLTEAMALLAKAADEAERHPPEHDKAMEACTALVEFANRNNTINLTGHLRNAVGLARQAVEGGKPQPWVDVKRGERIKDLVIHLTQLQDILRALCSTIQGTGGLVRHENGHVAPATDPEWVDMGDVAQRAFKCLAIEPTVNAAPAEPTQDPAQEPEIRSMTENEVRAFQAMKDMVGQVSPLMAKHGFPVTITERPMVEQLTSFHAAVPAWVLRKPESLLFIDERGNWGHPSTAKVFLKKIEAVRFWTEV